MYTHDMRYGHASFKVCVGSNRHRHLFEDPGVFISTVCIPRNLNDCVLEGVPQPGAIIFSVMQKNWCLGG